ncbi:acetylglutamate kinase [Pleionea sediminis]|uniref:acetylglutamate kinase n=1 Tax=Pleionea sediminis TaxID=2569479 RepID=UPI001184F67D|nr:acetylglutamate kinase [Pleionea sediminis]
MGEQSSPLAVIKVGGDVLLDPAEKQGLASNVKSLQEHGWQVVLLHGGGPQTNRLQEQLGMTPVKVAGRRVTSEDDLTVVKQAIAGEVNVDLTSLLQSVGVNAFGFHGASGRLVEAVKRPPRVMSGAGPDPVDFGEVGDVTSINGALLSGILSLGIVPVIATLGMESSGRIFNINADTTVVQIAKALKADLLLLTTQVGAVFEDLAKPETRIESITPKSASSLIESGIIQGGMIPKVEEAITLLDEGVGSIAIVSGREPGAFMSVVQHQGKYGTVIHKDN